MSDFVDPTTPEERAALEAIVAQIRSGPKDGDIVVSEDQFCLLESAFSHMPYYDSEAKEMRIANMCYVEPGRESTTLRVKNRTVVLEERRRPSYTGSGGQ